MKVDVVGLCHTFPDWRRCTFRVVEPFYSSCLRDKLEESEIRAEEMMRHYRRTKAGSLDGCVLVYLLLWFVLIILKREDLMNDWLFPL